MSLSISSSRVCKLFKMFHSLYKRRDKVGEIWDQCMLPESCSNMLCTFCLLSASIVTAFHQQNGFPDLITTCIPLSVERVVIERRITFAYVRSERVLYVRVYRESETFPSACRQQIGWEGKKSCAVWQGLFDGTSVCYFQAFFSNRRTTILWLSLSLFSPSRFLTKSLHRMARVHKSNWIVKSYLMTYYRLPLSRNACYFHSYPDHTWADDVFPTRVCVWKYVMSKRMLFHSSHPMLSCVAFAFGYTRLNTCVWVMLKKWSVNCIMCSSHRVFVASQWWGAKTRIQKPWLGIMAVVLMREGSLYSWGKLASANSNNIFCVSITWWVWVKQTYSYESHTHKEQLKNKREKKAHDAPVFCVVVQLSIILQIKSRCN